MLPWCYTASRALWARDSCVVCHHFDLSLLPRSMDRDNSIHNHWFLIAENQKIVILEAVSSEEDIRDQNGKPFQPPPIQSDYCHYSQTLLILPKDLTCLWKLVPWQQQFSFIRPVIIIRSSSSAHITIFS